MAFKVSSILVLFLVLEVVCFFSGGSHSRMSCPQSLKVEKGNNITISCSHENMTLASSYWYKGDPSLSSPILRTEEGVPGGKEYGKGHYDITSAGGMIITGATIHQEGVYWFLSYFDDGSFEKHNVNVNVTITPYHICPVIDICSSCEVCSKSVNRTGSLKCSITESRPKLSLKWLIKFRKGIKIFKPTLTEEKNIFSDAWNTSTQIEYVATSCSQKAVLLCVAQDDMDLLMYKHSSININSENCTADGIDIENEFPGTTVIATVVSLSVCLSVALITCFICFIGRKRNNGNNGSKTPGDLELCNNYFNENTSRNFNTEEAKNIISRLKEVYKPYCFFEGLPFEDPVPAESFCTGCQCQVTFSDGVTSTLASDKLLTRDHFKSESQVVITGDRGTGKTTLLTQIVTAWVHEKDNDFILVFTSLEGATKDTNLTDLINRNMFAHNLTGEESLREIIKKNNCLVLLDGLEKISPDSRGIAGSIDSGNSELKCSTDANMANECLTIGSLLNAQFKEHCKNMKVWTTTRDHHLIQNFGLDGNCKVMLKGFSDEQVRHYIIKTYSYLTNFERQNVSAQCHTNDERQDCTNGLAPANSSLSNERPISEEEKVGLLKASPQHVWKNSSDDSKHDICDNVYKLLQKYDIVNNLREKPLLLFLIARIYVATFVVEIPFAKNTTTWNVHSITDYMMNCLVSKLTGESNPERFQKYITFLEEKALQLTFKKINFHTNTDSVSLQDEAFEDAIDEAIDIGFLQERQIHSLTDNKSDRLVYYQDCDITFCSQYFQDYFATCGFLKDPNKIRQLTKNVSKFKEEECSSLVKFLCYLNESVLEEFCDFFLKNSWFNCAIDCVYEAIKEQYKERIIREICGTEITIRSLGSHYHENAVTYFFQHCKDKNVRIHSVIFQGEFSNSFLKKLCFSSILKVEFVKKHITAEDFVYILKQMTKDNCTKELKFLMCDFEDLSDKRDEIQNMEHIGLAVYRQPNLSDVVSQKFNFETLEWNIGKIKLLMNAAMK